MSWTPTGFTDLAQPHSPQSLQGPESPAATPASRAEVAALAQHGLYDPRNEKDACGVGFVAHIKGQRAHSFAFRGTGIYCDAAIGSS